MKKISYVFTVKVLFRPYYIERCCCEMCLTLLFLGELFYFYMSFYKNTDFWLSLWIVCRLVSRDGGTWWSWQPTTMELTSTTSSWLRKMFPPSWTSVLALYMLTVRIQSIRCIFRNILRSFCRFNNRLKRQWSLISCAIIHFDTNKF